MARARTQAGNLAHAIKTPLAALAQGVRLRVFRARVGAGASLERVTVGDDETVAADSRPEPGSRI